MLEEKATKAEKYSKELEKGFTKKLSAAQEEE
jgi:hypothetical protein